MKSICRTLFTILLTVNMLIQTGTAVSAESVEEVPPQPPVLTGVFRCDSDQYETASALSVSEQPKAVAALAAALGESYAFSGEVTVTRPDQSMDQVTAIAKDHYVSTDGTGTKQVYYSETFPDQKEIRFVFRYIKNAASTGGTTDSSKPKTGGMPAGTVKGDYASSLRYEDSRVKITVSAPSSAQLPKDTAVRAEYLSEDSTAYESAVNACKSLGLGDNAEYVFYDISLVSGGKTVSPKSSVSVTMTFQKPVSPEEGTMRSAKIIHVKSNGRAEVLKGNVSVKNNAVREIRFSSSSFSPFGLGYAVSHVYDSFSCTLKEGTDIALSDLFEELDISESVSDVDQIRISDASVLSAAKSGKAWMIHCSSASEEEKTMTVIMKNGDSYVISVTAEANTAEAETVPEVSNETPDQNTPAQNENDPETRPGEETVPSGNEENKTDQKEETNPSRENSGKENENRTESLNNESEKKQTYSITIVKTDADDPAQPIQGAVYRLSDEDGDLLDRNGDPVEFTTDETGKFTVEGDAETLGWELEKDRVYYLSEVTPAEGYAKDDEPLVFTISDTQDIEREIYANASQIVIQAKSSIEVTVKKVWDDTEDHDRDSVTIRLQQKIGKGEYTDQIRLRLDGVWYDFEDMTVVLDREHDWKGIFSDLPLFVPEEINAEKPKMAAAEYLVREVLVNDQPADPSRVTVERSARNPYDFTVTNQTGSSGTEASVTVKVSFEGIGALPEGYRITNSIENGLFIPKNAIQGDGSEENPYVWTLSGIPDGSVVTFMQQNFFLDGYEVSVNGRVPEDAEDAAVTVTADADKPAVIEFHDRYAPSAGTVEITNHVSGLSEKYWPEQWQIAVLGRDDGEYYLPDGTIAEEPEDAWVSFRGDEATAVWTGLPEGRYVILENETAAEVKDYLLSFGGDIEFTLERRNPSAQLDVETAYLPNQGVLDVTLFLESGTKGEPLPEETEDMEYRVSVRNTETLEFFCQDGTVAETEEEKWITIPLSNPSRWVNLPDGIYAVDADLAGAMVEGYELTHYTTPEDGYIRVTRRNTSTKPADYTDTLVYTKNAGSLTVTKIVKGLPKSESQREYQIAVRSYDGIYYLPDGTEQGKQRVYTSFTGGESITWHNLPSGTYVIEEDVASAEIDHYTLTIRGAGEIQVDAAETAHAEVRNIYSSAKSDLQVRLDVSGAPASAARKTYQIAVRDAAGMYFKSDGAIAGTKPVWVTIRAGETKTWKSLKAGSYYVEENPEAALIENYSLTISGIGEVIVSAGSEKLVTITNTYETSGTLRVTKKVSGAPESAADKTYQIAVRDSHGIYFMQNGVPAGKKPFYVGIKASETKNWNNLPSGTYTVIEDVESAKIENYSLRISGDGNFNVTKGNKVTSVITNTYSLIVEVGNVRVTKEVRGAPMSAAGQQYRIAVKSINGSYYLPDGTRAVSQAAAWVSFIAGESRVWKNLPVGKYILEEELASANISGYTLTIASSGTFEVRREHTVRTPLTVSLVNSYKQNGGSTPTPAPTPTPGGSSNPPVPAPVPSITPSPAQGGTGGTVTPAPSAVPGGNSASGGNTGTGGTGGDSGNSTSGNGQSSGNNSDNTSGSGSTPSPSVTPGPSATPNSAVPGAVITPEPGTAEETKKKAFPATVLYIGGGILAVLIAGAIVILRHPVKDDDEDESDHS